jgi:hypothetical protein
MAQAGTSGVQPSQTVMGQWREVTMCSDPQKRNERIPPRSLTALPARCGIPVGDMCGVSHGKGMGQALAYASRRTCPSRSKVVLLNL